MRMKDNNRLVEFDIQEHDIGLILNSIEAFESETLQETLYDLKKIVYLFGDKLLYNIKDCIILMDENEKMESISSSAFDITESLALTLTLADFDPEGEFESRKMVVDHYETLWHIFLIWTYQLYKRSQIRSERSLIWKIFCKLCLLKKS